jgi:hypothetical protein
LNVGTRVQYTATAAGTSNQAMPWSIATAAARLLDQVGFGPTELTHLSFARFHDHRQAFSSCADSFDIALQPL